MGSGSGPKPELAGNSPSGLFLDTPHPGHFSTSPSDIPWAGLVTLHSLVNLCSKHLDSRLFCFPCTLAIVFALSFQSVAISARLLFFTYHQLSTFPTSILKMKYFAVLSALAVAAYGQDAGADIGYVCTDHVLKISSLTLYSASASAALITALPTSLLQLAITNAASASAVIASVRLDAL